VSRPAGSLVWVHCASVGELLTVVPLIGCLREKGFAVLCTSGTVTSANIAAMRLPAGTIHQFVALDVPAFVNRFFDHWRPDLGLFVESDLWPNMILTAAERGIALILLNGRLSERSFQHWRWAPHTIAKLLRCFDLCLAQSATHAERYRELGAPRVTSIGNLKLDVPEPPANAHALAQLKTAIGERAMLAGASTHPGEETALIEVHRRLRNSFPRLLTVIAPRHPERGPDVVEMAREAQLVARLRSRGELPDAGTAIYVMDTMGELGLLYRLAPIVFVGGSLATHGGQNPIEPAKLGAAIVHGPHVWNFAEIYSALDNARGAAQVTDTGKLAVRVGAWLKDAGERAEAVAAARATVASLGGALGRTLAAIEPYLMQLRLEHPPDA
jgi:3-deoxy-D-manno-octulosonic-acid transferase